MLYRLGEHLIERVHDFDVLNNSNNGTAQAVRTKLLEQSQPATARTNASYLV